MERNDVFNKVKEICKDVFDDENLNITETTKALDVDGWDSLTHLSLINELEETFEIAFTLEEMSGNKSIGDLVNIIMCHKKIK